MVRFSLRLKQKVRLDPKPGLFMRVCLCVCVRVLVQERERKNDSESVCKIER